MKVTGAPHEQPPPQSWTAPSWQYLGSSFSVSGAMLCCLYRGRAAAADGDGEEDLNAAPTAWRRRDSMKRAPRLRRANTDYSDGA